MRSRRWSRTARGRPHSRNTLGHLAIRRRGHRESTGIEPPTRQLEIRMHVFSQYRDEIFAAFWVTVKLTLLSGIGALILGTVLAATRLSPVPALRWIATTYVNLVRNTPLTLIILFCSFGL